MAVQYTCDICQQIILGEEPLRKHVTFRGKNSLNHSITYQVDSNDYCRDCAFVVNVAERNFPNKTGAHMAAFITVDNIEYDRAELGVDGDHAFALLGPNIQEGEAEFIPCNRDNYALAAKEAFATLRARLVMPELSYYIGPSHPDFI